MMESVEITGTTRCSFMYALLSLSVKPSRYLPQRDRARMALRLPFRAALWLRLTKAAESVPGRCCSRSRTAPAPGQENKRAPLRGAAARLYARLTRTREHGLVPCCAGPTRAWTLPACPSRTGKTERGQRPPGPAEPRGSPGPAWLGPGRLWAPPGAGAATGAASTCRGPRREAGKWPPPPQP